MQPFIIRKQTVSCRPRPSCFKLS